MADKWEEVFRNLAENTHSITQILDETNEGDELDEKYKEIEAARDAVLKAAKEAPSDIPDFYDDSAQLDLSNAANIPVTACDKLVTALNEKTDIWKEKKDLGKIVKEVVHTNSEVLAKPYPAANPNAPKIMGQTKKAEAESNRLAKAHAKPAEKPADS
ncbi:hypothetical protein DOTSEDRAFT_74569 [Dothistroma septosporum NZE10]|uniref:Uncharacterized protein n=1 Tax=Dothistroma septosporum (strain NZE10 / CBS 128990) TaxID=675120 RepID=N1PEM0_DOTSN|nr:hypothetical protein DOTSEDRAFT_74569 [Dothistroma septosporum NZE10]